MYYCDKIKKMLDDYRELTNENPAGIVLTDLTFRELREEIDEILLGIERVKLTSIYGIPIYRNPTGTGFHIRLITHELPDAISAWMALESVKPTSGAAVLGPKA